jgi:putative ABC transport system permease protein
MEQRPLDAALVTLLSLLSVAVLCVACANVAGLLSSRAPARAREMALRLAVGASRARLVRQLLTETLGIALLGAVGGLVVARVTMLLLGQVQFPSDVIQPPPFELDQRGLIFGLLVATATTILVGLGPAMTTTRVDLVSDLKAGDRSGTGRSRLAGRSVLVSSQVALSLMLLTVAGFTVQVARRELTNGPGFRATQMVKVTIDPGQAHYSPARAEQFFTELVERTRAMPGVTAATITSAAPLYARMQFVSVVPDGGSADAQASGPSWRGGPGTPAWAASVDHAYFDVYEIGLVAGRVFSKADDEKSAPVVIVNDTLARHYWPGQSAIGQRVEVIEGTHLRATVVGVVKTTKYLYLGEPPQDGIFFPYRQRERSQMTLVLATNGDSTAMLDPVRELVQSMDPDVPTLDLQTIERFYQAHTRLPLVATRLIVGLGLVGLCLTIVGLYGLVSYGVSRRTREIGIRIAIGASYLRIIRMIVSEGMVAAWTGLAIGLVLSALTARSLPSLVPVNDPVSLSTFYLVVPLLAMVTILAAFIPARRAANVSPTIALRVE